MVIQRVCPDTCRRNFHVKFSLKQFLYDEYISVSTIQIYETFLDNLNSMKEWHFEFHINKVCKVNDIQETNFQCVH
jgi:hypothetical protein